MTTRRGATILYIEGFDTEALVANPKVGMIFERIHLPQVVALFRLLLCKPDHIGQDCSLGLDECCSWQD